MQVRVDGRLQPLELPAARNDGASHLQVAVTPAGARSRCGTNAARAPGVEVREGGDSAVGGTPQAPAQASSSRPDPRPGAVRATSAASSARPAAPLAATPAPATAEPPPAHPAAPAAPAKPERAPEPTGTSGGGRFGLLEID